jgi:PAS domain S-box-containing protein
MNHSEVQPELAPELFSGGGAMGESVRSKDWTQTPFGAREHWPQSLKTATALMLESSFAMVVAWGPEFRFLYNDRYRPIIGNKHPFALGAAAKDIFPEVWDLIEPLFMRTRRGEAVAIDDLLIPLHRHGYLENCYFTIAYSPIRDETGGVGGMLAVVAETTTRVEGERRLTTLRELARRAVDAATPTEACRNASAIFRDNATDVPFALMYLLDRNGAIAELVSAAGIEIGQPAAPPSINCEGDSETEAWPLSAVLKTGKPLLVQNVIDRFGPLPSGPFPESVPTALVQPLTRPGRARPYGFLVVGVSARRTLNERYRDFFELAAEHITTAIANAWVREEERRRAEALAEIDRAKTAFFSNVSHEFRTPLTLMLGPLEQARVDRNYADEAIELAHRNSRRLLKLVNSLLDFSRLEAGRMDASFEPVDLSAYTADLASCFRSAIEAAGLQLVVDCPPLREAVHVDREMWEKIVFNLLSNALKFTFKGRIEVRLGEATRESKDRQTPEHSAPAVCLTVSDTGTGIAAGELPRIFERFHRVRNARARSHEGTGIGLALVQELVRLHGGNVSVTSIEGRGTAFSVMVPLGTTHLQHDRIAAKRTLPSTRAGAEPFVQEALRWLAPADDAIAARIEQPQGQNPSGSITTASAAKQLRESVLFGAGKNPRILIADDNADMREYLSRLLQKAGYEVAAVANGLAALDFARRQHPSLVISDVMMPGLDGFSLVRELRQTPDTRMTSIILVSARAGEEARVEGALIGADDYLTKPFSARELLARVEMHLNLARLRQQAADASDIERRKLYELLLLAPAAICVLRGPEHVFELANPAYIRLARRNHASEVVGRTVREALPEIGGQGFFEMLDRVYATGEPFVGREMKVTLQRSDGFETEDAYVDFVYLPTRDFEGHIDGIFVHAVDISEQVGARKVAEELAGRLEHERDRVRANEEYLRAIVDNTPECVKLVARDGTLLDMNPAGLAMIEARSAADAVGKCVYDLIAPADRERFRIFNERVCSGERGALEFDVVGLSGSVRIMETHAVPLRNRDGFMVQLAVTRDITDVVSARQTLAERRAELERLVGERTASLRAAIEQMEEFSYSVSHDLRSPVRAMRGYAEAMLADYGPQLDDEGRELLARIQRNGLRMDRLIQDLLTYTRVGRRDVPFETVSVERLIREVIQHYPEMKPDRANIEIVGPLPEVHAHEPSLTQVVSNLLDNAVKFVPPERRPRVRVWAERRADTTRIWFEDNGIGIQPELQGRLFGMFERVHPEQNFEGTGIGLAIVRKAVERMNGRVGVVSDGRSGSRFWIELPVAQRE